MLLQCIQIFVCVVAVYLNICVFAVHLIIFVLFQSFRMFVLLHWRSVETARTLGVYVEARYAYSNMPSARVHTCRAVIASHCIELRCIALH